MSSYVCREKDILTVLTKKRDLNCLLLFMTKIWIYNNEFQEVQADRLPGPISKGIEIKSGSLLMA